jgi:hypothetical protein
VVAPPRETLTPRNRTFLGGVLAGFLGTSGMILVGVGAEAGSGLPFSQFLPELELGFGGPWAGVGSLGSGFALPVHYLHGVILGLLFAGIIVLGERLRVAPEIPLWSSGLIFGAVVSGIVLVLLRATSNAQLIPGLVGLVVLMHLTFGGLAGILFQRIRGIPEPGTAV